MYVMDSYFIRAAAGFQGRESAIAKGESRLHATHAGSGHLWCLSTITSWIHISGPRVFRAYIWVQGTHRVSGHRVSGHQQGFRTSGFRAPAGFQATGFKTKIYAHTKSIRHSWFTPDMATLANPVSPQPVPPTSERGAARGEARGDGGSATHTCGCIQLHPS